MKLTYKILWIDDQIEDYIDMGINNEIETYIESLGFDPKLDYFENGHLAQDALTKENYDLILSDYNIEGTEEKGDLLIQKIRDGGVFTEILFYSAQSDFESIAKNLYRDRVSFYSLIGDESFKGFKEKVFTLINLTIHKLQELNNVRGLVMAETSELDSTVEDILLSFLSKENEESQQLRQYICDIILSSNKSNLGKASKFCSLSNVDIVNSRLFDADKKSRAINRLLELLKENEDKFLSFYSNYKQDVLDVRNDLAHAKSEIIDGIEYLIISRGHDEQPVKFDQEKCIQIRKQLKTHSSILKSIREKIIA